ncbi:MAG: hypothetical protein US63_C0016G0015 [Candidatus Moranbacteria bacterium GW2011_GWC2_37_8]|nr:MAG: hypothetical protein US63_C0016G0015 [Candidatus Moranbacteria bacterium GW2011_GWC2_37_8]KKQ62496.1 MAG: hypothetical protein US82_C0010G0016 [Parcubacteria group bacterium GW2011_GWC1_38_22]KKQ81074.1 MAG: hypothetical protein UT03_C0013G0006 [Candidatus Moranbacteria bacterium GW2011_GWD2_38_7]
MRLKFLFFPLIIIISLSIFIGYIWPELENLKNANEEKISNQDALKAIKDKKTAIQTIDAQINSDSEGETIINNYLPNRKIEERILTGVNFLATDSGVSLANISLQEGSDAANKNDEAQSLSLMPLAAVVGAAANQSNQNSKDAKDVSDIQFTQTSITVSGDYDKIRLFLDQVQRMSIFNSIKSLSITSQYSEDETKKDTTVEANEQTSQAESSTNLSANVVIDFGWMNTVKIDNQKIASFKAGLDNSTIAAVKQYVSQKAPGADRTGDSNGKKNPFLP